MIVYLSYVNYLHYLHCLPLPSCPGPDLVLCCADPMLCCAVLCCADLSLFCSALSYAVLCWSYPVLFWHDMTWPALVYLFIFLFHPVSPVFVFPFSLMSWVELSFDLVFFRVLGCLTYFTYLLTLLGFVYDMIDCCSGLVWSGLLLFCFKRFCFKRFCFRRFCFKRFW